MKIWSHWKQFPEAEWRWPSFSPQEMACRGTGKLAVNERAMDMLQALRDRIGKPFIVNSAYRSPEHNRAVGGAKRSQHMEAIAFDVSMGNHFPDEFIEAAKAAGFKGIGTYPKSNFVHIDARSAPARWGDPFPPRQTRFAPETPPAEVAKPKEKDRAAATGAAGGLSAAVVADVVLNGGDTIEKVGGLPVGLQIVVGLALAALVGLFVWRQVRGAKG